MYFVVWNVHTVGMEATRRRESDAMKAYLQSHSRVTLHHGGATLDDDAQAVVGGLMIIEAPSLEVARNFVAHSPFGEAGLFSQSRIQPWNWLTGRPT